ncbi:MAG: PocR ligand-binding domain-containing protein [Treponema sp.]|jgi:AraC-like DNA-binding protein/ligand-binding sensor protein|nr:PocR ligand-binding domain-containing protein [Treponema sp.]
MLEKLGIFYNEEVERYIESFVTCFNVRFVILSLEFEDMITGSPHVVSPYCHLVRYKLHKLTTCLHQNRQGCRRCQKESQNGTAPFVYRCYAGLNEVVIPIIVNGRHIGYAMIGQFRTYNDDRSAPEIPGELIDMCGKLGLDGALRKTWDELPLYDRKTTESMVNLFYVLINFIVMREYLDVHQPDLTEKILRWLDNHITDAIELDALASAMRCSRSTISHTIKRRLGISFRQLCAQKKVYRFEKIIAVEPSLTIAEAARRVGYDDPLYFSRLYKRIRFITPSTYVKSVRDNSR